MARKYTFFESYFEAVEDLPDADRLAFLDAINLYAFRGVEPDFGAIPHLRIAWTLVKPSLDTSLTAFENGRKGGRPQKAAKAPAETPETPLLTPLFSLGKGIGIGNGIGDGNTPPTPKGKTRSVFKAPTIEEVDTYLKEKGITSFSAAEFIGYYGANGWRVGRNPMKNWKLAVTSWDARRKNEPKTSKQEAEERYAKKAVYLDAKTIIA